MMSGWSVLWAAAALAFVANAAPSQNYGNYGQVQETTMSDIAEDSSTGFDCANKDNGAQGEGCSSSYWLCWNGVATSQECPNNLMFNMDNGQCDFEANVIECGGVATTPVTASDNATPMPVDFDCTSVEDGQYAFKNGDVCQPKFVSCVGGIAWETACPEGLMFDPDLLLCQLIDAIVACGGTAEPISTTTYSYTYRTTPAAEPTTLKSYGSYQAPAVKLAEPVRRIEKTSYGSYQAPAVKLAEPVRRIEKASYGSYQTTTPAFEPTTKSYGSYQAPAAEPTTRLRIKTTVAADQPSYGSYETLAAEPITLRHVKKITTLAAEPTTLDYGFELASEPEIHSVYGSYETTPAAEPTTREAYGSYQAPAAEPIRRHIKTTLAAEPITKSYGSYETPAAEPATRRPMKKTTLASEPITKSYGSYQTTVLADEPVTRSYQQTTLAAEPTTRLRSVYGSQKIFAAPALKPIMKEQQPY
jgi:hypothetical protein